VGGPADVVFLPADEQDLADFLKALDPAVPVLAIGVGSNLLVRDGGVEGVVIRLGKGFNTVEPLGDNRIRAGSAVPDAILARKAAEAGIAGLEFYAGIPGTVGGAVIMNAGCYGSETVNVILFGPGHGPPGPGARNAAPRSTSPTGIARCRART
jgi:UDP-N-acetylmuramate dehydrogenase